MAGGEDAEIKGPPDGGPEASEGDHGNQRHHGQDGRQTVEYPFTARDMDFQVMHRMVNTVQTTPQRQDDHQEDERAADEAARKRHHALVARRRKGGRRRLDFLQTPAVRGRVEVGSPEREGRGWIACCKVEKLAAWRERLAVRSRAAHYRCDLTACLPGTDEDGERRRRRGEVGANACCGVEPLAAWRERLADRRRAARCRCDLTACLSGTDGGEGDGEMGSRERRARERILREWARERGGREKEQGSKSVPARVRLVCSDAVRAADTDGTGRRCDDIFGGRFVKLLLKRDERLGSIVAEIERRRRVCEREFPFACAKKIAPHIYQIFLFTL